jgi:pyruvate formate lyase activating enzyme
MRCVYCYNKDIVFGEGEISEEEAIAFLQSRVGLLEAVVLSGGEVTLYNDLVEFCKKIKQLKFKIKLDTNGLNTEMIQVLVENRLVDYIALDYKAPKEKYFVITKDKHFDNFSKTLNYLIQKEFSFEVRTTVHNDLLRVEEINRIIKDLLKRGYSGTYYLQPFVFTENTIGKVQEEKNAFDISKISNELNVVWR